jgi:uncharacterized membrane protein
MWQWLRRNFIAGLFVTIPLAVSVIALVWVFRFADRLTSGLGTRLLGEYAPGLGIAITLLGVLAVGTFATNVIGRRLLRRGESLLMQVPVFRTIYGPVKQIIEAFAPGNEFGFKRVVLVEGAGPLHGHGMALGFLTREFTIERDGRTETLMAVFVPTNHLYLGDVVVCTPDRVSYPRLTIEEGIRVFLTGGMGLPDQLTGDGSVFHRSGADGARPR